ARVEAFSSKLPPAMLLHALSRRLTMTMRSSARVRCQGKVRATRVDGTMLGQIENVSLSGLLLVTEASCAIGEKLEVEFELPDRHGTVRGSVSAVRVA